MTTRSHGASHVTVILALDIPLVGFAATRTFFGGAFLPEDNINRGYDYTLFERHWRCESCVSSTCEKAKCTLPMYNVDLCCNIQIVSVHTAGGISHTQ